MITILQMLHPLRIRRKPRYYSSVSSSVFRYVSGVVVCFHQVPQCSHAASIKCLSSSQMEREKQKKPNPYSIPGFAPFDLHERFSNCIMWNAQVRFYQVAASRKTHTLMHKIFKHLHPPSPFSRARTFLLPSVTGPSSFSPLLFLLSSPPCPFFFSFSRDNFCNHHCNRNWELEHGTCFPIIYLAILLQLSATLK